MACLATAATTIFAFGSLLPIRGRMGDLWRAADGRRRGPGWFRRRTLFVLATGHTRRLDARGAGNATRLERIEAALQRAQQRVLMDVLAPRYLAFLRPALEFRYFTLAVAVAVLIVSIGMAASGRPRFDFLGTNDSETIVANLRMPVGTPAHVTDAVIARLEAAALAQPEVTTALAVVGAQGSSDGTNDIAQPHLGQLWIELTPAEQRLRTSDELIVAIRGPRRTGGVKSLRIDGISGGPEGPPLSLTVSGENPTTSPPPSPDSKSRWRRSRACTTSPTMPIAASASCASNCFPARELGFNTQNLAMQVRAAVYGIDAHVRRSRRGR